MTLDALTHYLQMYGYWVIILVLFCGIIGIPAPEETFIIFIGAFIAEQNLNLLWSISAALLGANIGMFVTYMIGRKLGTPLIEKYGGWLKITPERWGRLQAKFDKFDNRILILGYFLPGLRQLTPYMSGTRALPPSKFFSLAFLGSLLWTTLYMAIGFYFGSRIGLKYLSLMALTFFLIFIAGLVWKNWLSPGRTRVNS